MNDHPEYQPMGPAELNLLESVLDLVCQRRGVDKASLDAENIAAELVQLYEHGVRQEVELGALIS